MEIWHSAQGNGKFVLTPYKIPRGPMCTSLNKDYRKFLMDDLKGVSNLPYSEDPLEDLCPQFYNVCIKIINLFQPIIKLTIFYFIQTKFELKDFIMSKSPIPSDFAEGTYKAIGYMFKGDVLENAIVIIINVF